MRRLRKRLKAESMRLLDMERRQKQRVEEIRETQKKVSGWVSLSFEFHNPICPLNFHIHIFYDCTVCYFCPFRFVVSWSR